MPRRRRRHTPPKKPKIIAQQHLPTASKKGERRLVFLTIKIVSVFLGICTVLGVVLWWPFYVAKIHIDVSSASNDTLMAEPPSFSINNSGVFAAYSLRLICYSPYVHIQDTKTNITISEAMQRITLPYILHGGDSIDVSCKNIISNAVTVSEIQLFLSFIPAFTWKSSYVCARFKLEHNAHNKLQWFHMASPACKHLWLQFDARIPKEEPQ